MNLLRCSVVRNSTRQDGLVLEHARAVRVVEAVDPLRLGESLEREFPGGRRGQLPAPQRVPRAVAEPDLVRGRDRLDPRREVHRVAEDVPVAVEDVAERDRGAHGHAGVLRHARLGEPDLLLQPEGGPRRGRDAREDGPEGVALPLDDRSSVPGEDGRRDLLVPREQRAQLGRRHPADALAEGADVGLEDGGGAHVGHRWLYVALAAAGFSRGGAGGRARCGW